MCLSVCAHSDLEWTLNQWWRQVMWGCVCMFGVLTGLGVCWSRTLMHNPTKSIWQTVGYRTSNQRAYYALSLSLIVNPIWTELCNIITLLVHNGLSVWREVAWNYFSSVYHITFREILLNVLFSVFIIPSKQSWTVNFWNMLLFIYSWLIVSDSASR